jgi:hypothetical protein
LPEILTAVGNTATFFASETMFPHVSGRDDMFKAIISLAVAVALVAGALAGVSLGTGAPTASADTIDYGDD